MQSARFIRNIHEAKARSTAEAPPQDTSKKLLLLVLILVLGMFSHQN